MHGNKIIRQYLSLLWIAKLLIHFGQYINYILCYSTILYLYMAQYWSLKKSIITVHYVLIFLFFQTYFGYNNRVYESCLVH